MHIGRDPPVPFGPVPAGTPDGVLLFFHGGGLKEAAAPIRMRLSTAGGTWHRGGFRGLPDVPFGPVPRFYRGRRRCGGWLWEHADRYGLENVRWDGLSEGRRRAAICHDALLRPKYLAAEGLDRSVSGVFPGCRTAYCSFQSAGRIGKDTRAIVVDETAPLFFVGEPALILPDCWL